HTRFDCDWSSDVCSSDLVSYELRNLICSRVQREMARFEDVDFRLRHILTVAFRFAEVEREVVLPPNHEKARLLLPHPCLPFRVRSEERRVGKECSSRLVA